MRACNAAQTTLPSPQLSLTALCFDSNGAGAADQGLCLCACGQSLHQNGCATPPQLVLIPIPPCRGGSLWGIEGGSPLVALAVAGDPLSILCQPCNSSSSHHPGAAACGSLRAARRCPAIRVRLSALSDRRLRSAFDGRVWARFPVACAGGQRPATSRVWASAHIRVLSTRLRAGCSRADCLRLFCYLCSAGLLPVTPPTHHTPSHTRRTEFLAIPCDVLVPAALGGVINSRIAPKLQCKVRIGVFVCLCVFVLVFVCDRCRQRWAACVVNSRIAP